MRRKLSLLIAFVGVFGLLGLAPTAQADHTFKGTNTNSDHELQPSAPSPQEGGTCEVIGQVQVGDSKKDGGVSTQEAHNHYRFIDTSIECQDLTGVGDDMSAFAGPHDVEAAGGTDGPWNVDNTAHGEDDLQGWSHKSCYDGTCSGFGYTKATGESVNFGDIYDGTQTNDGTQCTNCGEILVDPPAPSPEANVVMFDRVGTTVLAWGAIDSEGDIAEDWVCFLAELEFEPTNVSDSGKTVEALLTGAAEIWGDNDKGKCGVNNFGGKK